jgi:peptidoglycan/xylan/chitin deacetylase (PgdA/CDA1 family)
VSLHDSTLESDRSRPGVAVLLYHRLVEDPLYESLPLPESVFSIPVSRFREQIEYLARAGYQTLSLERFERILSGTEPPPPRAALITFDDGCESVFRLAAPILRSHRMPAVVFVTSDPASRVFLAPESQRRLSDEEIRQLDGLGIACGSHGLSHAGLGDLDDAELRRELEESRLALGSVVGRGITSLALPLNSYTPRVLAAARAAGYRHIFSSNPGLVRPGDDPSCLRRILVNGAAPLEEFAGELAGAGLRLRRLLAWLKRLPPRWIGYRRWMPLRERLFRSPVGRFLTPRSLGRTLRAALALAIAAFLAMAAAALSRTFLRP